MPPRARPFGPLSTTRITVNGVSFDMVRVPPGRFVDGEGTKKRALLNSRPFEIGMTPVTQALWRAVTGKRPSRFRGNDRPVEKVSWHDVQTFLARLEALGLHGFRLPTEVEWAWAARCGATARWAGADRDKPVATVLQRGPEPVGGFLSSAAGAFDFSGNLWEWQQDAWSDPPAAGLDTEGPLSSPYGVLRGGSWRRDASRALVISRIFDFQVQRSGIYGFRLLRTLP
jgi:formylglycine-generating enzyme required for sulfatase activity